MHNKMNNDKTSLSKKFTDNEIIDSFRTFDLDKNNYIGAAELRHVLINIGINPTDEEVDEMIRMIDTDGDGQIGWNEFYHMVSDGKKCEINLFESNQKNNSQNCKKILYGKDVVEKRNQKIKILNEFVKENNIKYESIKKANKIFLSIDKDNSGVIDYTEFCEILQIGPTFSSQQTFILYDYDKCGLIEIRDFLISILNFTDISREERLKFSFGLFDLELNGIITHSELLKIIKNNHLGSYDSEVIRKVQVIITQVDKNGNGVITFDEFIDSSRKFPNIFFPAYHRVK